ncbi:MAG: MerR family transcriptional regulator [Deltaproteobacteria bacterium]
MENDSKLTFSIGDASKISGVPQKQIRNWEEKGYIPKAERLVSGVRAYRRFSPSQVKNLHKIKEFLDEGFTLSSAVNKTAGKNSIKEDSDNE